MCHEDDISELSPHSLGPVESKSLLTMSVLPVSHDGVIDRRLLLFRASCGRSPLTHGHQRPKKYLFRHTVHSCNSLRVLTEPLPVNKSPRSFVPVDSSSSCSHGMGPRLEDPFEATGLSRSRARIELISQYESLHAKFMSLFPYLRLFLSRLKRHEENSGPPNLGGT